MEVKIGVQHSPRELVIDSPKTPDEIAAEVSAAMSGSSKDGLLTLVDERAEAVEQALARPVTGGPHAGGRHLEPPPACRAGDDASHVMAPSRGSPRACEG